MNEDRRMRLKENLADRQSGMASRTVDLAYKAGLDAALAELVRLAADPYVATVQEWEPGLALAASALRRLQDSAHIRASEAPDGPVEEVRPQPDAYGTAVSCPEECLVCGEPYRVTGSGAACIHAPDCFVGHAVSVELAAAPVPHG